MSSKFLFGEALWLAEFFLWWPISLRIIAEKTFRTLETDSECT